MSEYRKPDNFIPVISNSGASGKFISTILTYSANNIDFPFDPRKTTADYHTEACSFMEEHTNLGWFGVPGDVEYWNKITFKNNSPCRIMAFAGGAINMPLTKFLNEFPNGKVLYITVKPEDILFVDLNHAWKLDIRLYLNQEEVDDLNSRNGFFDWRKEYSIDKVTQIVKDSIGLDKGHYPGHYFNTLDSRVRSWYSTLRPNAKEKVFLINFSDIVGNPELVIETLEEISGNVFTQNLLDTYAQYVNIQLDHYKEHIPWHPILKQYA